MRVERGEVLARVGIAGGGWGFDVRNVSRAIAPPTMDRMWLGPWGGRRKLDNARGVEGGSAVLGGASLRVS